MMESLRGIRKIVSFVLIRLIASTDFQENNTEALVFSETLKLPRMTEQIHILSPLKTHVLRIG